MSLCPSPRPPADCDLVNKCLTAIHAPRPQVPRFMHVTWVPSHAGIQHNEQEDCLARRALRDTAVDPGTEYTLSDVQNRIRDHFTTSTATQPRTCDSGSPGPPLRQCRQQPSACAYSYGRHRAAQDVVAMRLRLGYRYYWEASNSPGVCCKLCVRPGATHCNTVA